MGHRTLTNGTAHNGHREDECENWVMVDRIHYRFVPDPASLFRVLQMHYGRGNFYVEVGLKRPLQLPRLFLLGVKICCSRADP